MSVRMMMQGRQPTGGGGGGGGIAVEHTAGAQGAATLTHTIAGVVCAGSNRLLLVGMHSFGGRTHSSVTYGGVALTKLQEVLNNTGATRKVSLWYLVAPAAGSASVAASLDSSDGFAVSVLSLSGVHQSSPFGTVATATGSSTTLSVAASSAAGEMVVDAAVGRASGGLTKDASQTLAYAGIGGSNNAGGMSYEAGAASVTMSWTMGASDIWAILAAPVKPA